MAREREHRYLVTINSLVINVLSILLFIGFGYFIYYYIVNLSNIDIEGEFIKVLNIYGNNIIGFILYGLRYILVLLGCFLIYEVIKGIIYGIKNSCFVLRIEKGDLYCKCSNFIYKKRVILGNVLSYLIGGLLPFVLGIIINNIYLIIIGGMLLVFNVRDLIVSILLIKVKSGTYKYIDYKSRDKIVLDIRKDFDNYKSLLVKDVKLFEEDINDDNMFRISKLTVVMLLLLVLGVLVGVIL